MKTKQMIGVKALLLLAVIALSNLVNAQSILGGFFNQNATQTKYLLEQIAALQVYEGSLQKGYSIVKDGTGTISTIKNGDLSLHTAHFDSLKVVSASVRNYSKVKAIIQLQQQIVSSHDKVYPQLINGGQLTAQELDSYNKIYHAVLQQSGTDLEELQLVITNGKVQMSDDERMAAIDKLYIRMQNSYGQVQRLNNKALAVAAQRSRALKDNKALKSLYGQ